jgi:hypothetical protein
MPAFLSVSIGIVMPAACAIGRVLCQRQLHVLFALWGCRIGFLTLAAAHEATYHHAATAFSNIPKQVRSRKTLSASFRAQRATLTLDIRLKRYANFSMIA